MESTLCLSLESLIAEKFISPSFLLLFNASLSLECLLGEFHLLSLDLLSALSVSLSSDFLLEVCCLFLCLHLELLSGASLRFSLDWLFEEYHILLCLSLDLLSDLSLSLSLDSIILGECCLVFYHFIRGILMRMTTMGLFVTA